MAGGRPTKYKKSYCKSLTDLGKKGYTIIEVCSEWNLAKDTVYNWVKKHKQFSDAFKIYKVHSERWWINVGKNIMMGKVKNANATCYVWMTKNLHGWRDRVEHLEEEIDDIEFVD